MQSKMIEQMILKEKQSATYREDVVKEKPLRSIVKSLSWRLIGTLDTVLISWLITGELTLAFSIGSVELVTKMILYFFHERIWNNIKWGR